MKITSNKNNLSVFILILAAVSTMATVYMRVEVLDKAELNNLSCGWPMQYLSSGYPESRLDPPYPWTASCVDLLSGEWGDSVKVQWPNLILNIGFFYLLWMVLFSVSRMARSQKK
jgi:hypothetical protein